MAKHKLDCDAYSEKLVESDSILEALAKNRIVKFTPVNATEDPRHAGMFEIREKCDGYYRGYLTAAQLRAMAQELLEMAAAPEQEHEASPGFIFLDKKPEGGTPRVFVTIHHGCGGWNSAVWGWEPDGDGGFYQPLTSGVTNTLGRGTREEAVREATSWARSDELPLWIPKEAGDAV